MSTKLTLTINKETITKAKKYAKANNQSLSDIVESYLNFLTKEDIEGSKEELQPVVKSLKGSFKMPKKEMNYQEELRNRREEKYL
ncbi:MAG: DUF6364 family protein [Bacteroidota bacterium]